MQELVISWVQCAVVELSSLVEVHVYRYIASEISMYTYSSKLCSFCFLMKQIKVDSIEMECLSFFPNKRPPGHNTSKVLLSENDFCNKLYPMSVRLYKAFITVSDVINNI